MPLAQLIFFSFFVLEKKNRQLGWISHLTIQPHRTPYDEKYRPYQSTLQGSLFIVPDNPTARSRTMNHTHDSVFRGTNPRMGIWGQPTATIDWCELNYQYTPYIAEFWNTISNGLFVLLGCYGLVRAAREGFEWRFQMLYLSTIVIGLGSAMFHGTLQIVHQQFDETPMIWGMLVWIFVIYNKEIQQLPVRESTVVAVLAVFGFGFAVLHAIYHFTLVFQAIFGSLATICLLRIAAHYRASTDPRARAVCKSSMYAFIIGFAFWMADYNFCGVMSALPLNPQCHAWWHLLMGICTYNAPLFMQFVRTKEQDKKAEWVDSPWMGLQTIVVSDPKTKTL